MPALLVNSPCYAFKPNDAASCQTAIEDDATVLATHIDRGLYPGPYYRVMHLFVGEDVTRSVLVMRGFNVLLATLVFSLIALAMPVQGRRIMTLTLLGTSVPLVMFIVGSVNPSAWTILGVTATWLSLYALVHAGTRAREVAAALLMIAGAALAGVSRADGGAYVVVVTVAVLTVYAHRLPRSPALYVAAAASTGIGAWSFLTSSQSAAVSGGLGVVAERSALSVLFRNLTELPALWMGSFGLGGGLGWLDTAMPPLTFVSAIVVAGSLLMIGLRNAERWRLAGWAIVAGAATVLPLVILQRSLNYLPENVQPRYVIPLVIALVGIALMGGRGRDFEGLSLNQTVIVYVLLVAANSSALHANIRRYVTGSEVISFSLGRDVEWWWPLGPGPMVVWAAGTIGFAVLAVALFAVRDRGTGVGDSRR